MSVNHERVRLAMRDASRGLEATRQASIAVRNADAVRAGRKVCNCIEWQTKAPCTRLAVATYLPGPRCALHTPSAIAGHAEVVPDPALTLASLMRGDRPQPEPRTYGAIGPAEGHTPDGD